MATILIIEDNLEIRENSTEILELEGHEVIAAENGRIGVNKASENLPDLILCDIMMPELNGYQVLTELKKNSDTIRIPFIFISASTEKSEIQIGLDMGADEYIRKPFEVEELLNAINRCLQKTNDN